MNGLDIVHVWNDQPFLLNDEKPATFVIFIPPKYKFQLSHCNLLINAEACRIERFIKVRMMARKPYKRFGFVIRLLLHMVLFITIEIIGQFLSTLCGILSHGFWGRKNYLFDEFVLKSKVTDTLSVGNCKVTENA